MGRRKKNKHSEGKSSSENKPIVNTELTTKSDTKSTDQKILQPSTEKQVQSVPTCSEHFTDHSTVLTDSKPACHQPDTQDEVDSDAQSTNNSLNNYEDIQGLVSLWLDIIIESSNNDCRTSHTIGEKSSANWEQGTIKPDSYLNAPSSFNESICYDAAKWVHDSWARPSQQTEYTKATTFEMADVMIHGEIIVRAWNKQIQVGNIFYL